MARSEMRKHTITDAEAQQLLAGETPKGRPELAELTASIVDVRRAYSQAAPQPSVALVARLEQPALGGSVGSESEPTRGIKKMVSTISGLGIAAKIAAASAILALGLAGVGAAGALPGPAQDAFDLVVTSIVPTEGEGLDDDVTDECVVDDDTVDDGTIESTVEDGTEEGTDDGAEACVTVEPVLPEGSKEFSEWVRQGAQDPNKVGSEFGREVSEQARELRDEKAEERAENGNGNGNGGHRDGGDETDNDSQQGGKPAGTPGGRP